TTDGRPARGGPPIARPAGPVPVAPGPTGGIRGPGEPHHRERDAQRRGDPPRRRPADGPEVIFRPRFRETARHGTQLAPSFLVPVSLKEAAMSATLQANSELLVLRARTAADLMVPNPLS